MTATAPVTEAYVDELYDYFNPRQEEEQEEQFHDFVPQDACRIALVEAKNNVKDAKAYFLSNKEEILKRERESRYENKQNAKKAGKFQTGPGVSPALLCNLTTAECFINGVGASDIPFPSSVRRRPEFKGIDMDTGPVRCTQTKKTEGLQEFYFYDFKQQRTYTVHDWTNIGRFTKEQVMGQLVLEDLKEEVNENHTRALYEHSLEAKYGLKSADIDNFPTTYRAKGREDANEESKHVFYQGSKFILNEGFEGNDCGEPKLEVAMAQGCSEGEV